MENVSPHPVNPRSIILGLLGIGFISSLTAYNDFVVANTYLIGSALPLGLMLFFLLFVLLINGPLSKRNSRWAFSRAELAVALGMVLVSCAIPASGFMRYLPAQLIAPYYQAATNAEYRVMLDDAKLADWVYPSFESESARDRAADPIVTNFWNRDPRPRLSWMDNWRAVPWGAWMRPAFSWGILLILLYSMIFCAAVIVRRQWVENERLPFPIATIYTSLIESPRPGKALNPLFCSRVFWIGACAVFVVHGVNALHTYFPRHFPKIPIGYDLSTLMANPPWSYTWQEFQITTIYFAVVGIAFFVQTKIAFSMWFFNAIFYQSERMLFSTYSEFHEGAKTDQIFGGLIVYAAAILWVGRRHWAMVARQMFRPPGPEDPPPRYLPYRVAGWGFIACSAAIGLWMAAAGASAAGAVVIVLMMMLIMLATARAIAETGLVFVQFDVPLFQPWIYALNELPRPMQSRTTMSSFYLAAVTGSGLTRDVREPMPGYATHALKVADENAYPNERTWRSTAPFLAALALGLVVAYLVSGASILYVEYNYGATLDRAQTAPINEWAMVRGAKFWTLDPAAAYRPPGTGPREGHSRSGHFTFGAAFTAFLSLMRLRFMAWPFHPLGFLLAYSYPMQVLWFSIFIGWLIKVVLLRFGGSAMFGKARNLFIGLILGEVAAAAFWLIVSLLLHTMGLSYHTVVLFPA